MKWHGPLFYVPPCTYVYDCVCVYRDSVSGRWVSEVAVDSRRRLQLWQRYWDQPWHGLWCLSVVSFIISHIVIGAYLVYSFRGLDIYLPVCLQGISSKTAERICLKFFTVGGLSHVLHLAFWWWMLQVSRQGSQNVVFLIWQCFCLADIIS